MSTFRGSARKPYEKPVLPAYMEDLNEGQREAVLHTGSPLLILAGAGSGKTRVITVKIACMVDVMGIDPESILAVTFTNKAAGEMHHRVASLSPSARGVMIRTFHSFGAWLLRRNAHAAGLNPRFSIYDDDDSLSLLSSLMPGSTKRELKPFARWISRAKDYNLDPGDDLSSITRDTDFPAMYEKYQKKLKEMGNADFGELIRGPVELLRNNPGLRDRLRRRFRVILVDEYQDSNVAQFQLLQELFAEGTGGNQGTELSVVGDDDQSIYRFRGAEVRNILTFPDRFPGTRVIRLEDNYRSTGNILEIAGAVVSNNSERLGKTLRTNREEGPKGVITHVGDQMEEAEYCAELLKDRRYRETAILYRTNAQSGAFETCFLKRGIPYKVVGSLRFYEREEVKDALSLLSFFQNPRDEVAFRRIVNKPSRGIGTRSVDKLVDSAASRGLPISGVLDEMAPVLTGKAKEGVAGFARCLKAMEDALGRLSLSEFIKMALTSSGLLGFHREQDESALTRKVNNLEELASAAGYYPPGPEGLTSFLEDLELDRTRIGAGGDDPGDSGANGDGVTLITMHNTKGLEFERVIISGMEEGLFPSRPDESDDDLEEERRIFYVSITRAMRELHFTVCRSRMIWGRVNFQMPSRFLGEIPEELVRVQGGGYFDFENRGCHGSAGTSAAQGFSAAHGTRSAPGQDGLRYPAGCRVYHDDYGSGVVLSSRISCGNLAVNVRFDSGKGGVFLPKYTSLERIADEDW